MFQVHFHSELNVRLSYHDVKLFLRIFESAQRQINKAIEKPVKKYQPTDKQSPSEINEIIDNKDTLLITQKPISTEKDSLGLDLSAADSNAIGAVEEIKSFSLAGFEVRRRSIRKFKCF